MEETILRHYPEILQDPEYQKRRPIGMAYEKVKGYELILRTAGFSDIKTSTEKAECISTDEEEWWQQMLSVGWESIIEKIKQRNPDRLQQIKESVFIDIQSHKRNDGIHFEKTVFFVSCVKR